MAAHQTEPPKPEPSPKSRPYSVLCQTHPEYDTSLTQTLEDLYAGGFTILKKATTYLVRDVGENKKRYQKRCSVASYKPYLGQIIDQLCSDVFSQPLSVKAAADKNDKATPGEAPDEPFYAELEKDVDAQGTPLVSLLSGLLRSSLLHRYAILAVDLPAPLAGDAPVSLADEDERGQRRCYAYEVPLEQVIDWKLEPGGKSYAWAIVRQCEQERDTPSSDRGMVTETFTVWTRGGRVAHWARYQIRYLKDKKPKPDDSVALLDEDDTSFAEIPLLRLQMSGGLWAGNKLGPMALEHWQRRSELVGSQSRSLCAIAWVKKGPEAGPAGGSTPAEITENPNRGNDPVGRQESEGWVELGSEDEIGFAEPKGECYVVVDKQLNDLRDDMFHVEHMMAASVRPTGSALGRSGLSKQKDQDSTARVLRAIGTLVRLFCVRLYVLISTARGEDTHWEGHGLDGYESEDREQVIEEALTIADIEIPSLTFRKAHMRSVVEKILKGMDPSTLDTIINEIDAGVEEQEQKRKDDEQAQKDTQAAQVEALKSGSLLPADPNAPQRTVPPPGKKGKRGKKPKAAPQEQPTA